VRVLLTAHTYTAPGNHAKLKALAAFPDLELLVVVPEHWQDSLFTLRGAQSRGGYGLQALPTIGNRRPLAFAYRADLRALLHAFAPDILHIEQEPRSLVTAQWLWANGDRARTIIFTWENIEQPRRFPQWWFEQYALKHAHAFIGGNARVVELLRAKGWRGLTSVVPQLGIDPDDYQRAQDARLRGKLGVEDRFVVGFAGRLVDEKGIGDLMQAATGLPDLHLMVLGSGPWGDRLSTMPNVTLCPAVPHAEVPAYLAAMHVLVLPSRTTAMWKEQFGHVLIEAMACGVPVIGSDSGAIPEVIADAGLIFPEGDVSALRDCLIRLQSDAALRAELSARGRARVLAHYTHERIAEQTYAIYHQLLAEEA